MKTSVAVKTGFENNSVHLDPSHLTARKLTHVCLHRHLAATYMGSLKCALAQLSRPSIFYEMIRDSACRYRYPNLLHMTIYISYHNFNLCISQFQQCASPPPPHRADPRELAFFENELANTPPPGQKKLFKCPEVGAQKCFISFVS